MEWTSETGGVGKESNLSGLPISPIMIRDKSITGLGRCIGRPTARFGLSKKPIVEGSFANGIRKGHEDMRVLRMPMQVDAASVLVHVISVVQSGELGR